MRDVVLSVKDLKTYIYSNNKCNKVLNGITFDVKKAETLCVVGESGCGKSITASSIMQLLPPLSRIESGTITYCEDDKEIPIEKLKKNGKEMREIRGSKISMIFQDPMNALNPVYSIGYQIIENIMQHTKLSRKEAREKAYLLLKEMGIPGADKRIDDYPHQFSGGMRQRSMIAMAMSCEPSLLIADEPTTALDVTIQAQIFELMMKMKEEHGTSVMLITHDMGVVAETADKVIVMYMGFIMESGTVKDVLEDPRHPYTQALLRSIPIIGKGRNQKIRPIRGFTADPYNRPKGCQFAPRCDFYRKDLCDHIPPRNDISETHKVNCWLYEEGSRLG